MKKLKAILLMAVITLGVTSMAAGARTNCCSSAECCASCSGCK